MPDMNDFHAFKNTGGGGSSGGGSGRGFGCGWIAILVVAFFVIFCIFNGAGFDVIQYFLAYGIIAFLFLRWIST